MMPHSFVIAYDESPRVDDVILAVIPIDAFTGQVVRKDVTARIAETPDRRPIRNLSGHLVFIDKADSNRYPAGQEFEFSVSATRAGYFDPPNEKFDAPDRTDPDASKRRKIVPLHRLPSSIVDSDVTTVAGVLVRDERPMVGADVIAELPDSGLLPNAAALEPFKTRTDERGAFAMRLRLPADVGSEAMPVTFTFREGDDEREIERPVIEGKLNSFEDPIDLGGEEDLGSDDAPPRMLVFDF